LVVSAPPVWRHAEDLRLLATFLAEQGVQEVVMESTAQYWKPVWQELEGRFHLELAQALSNRGRRGRKSDFRDAERLVRRYAADELILSFVPDPEQRLWRTLARTKQRWCREKSRLHSRVEALLEEMRIKLSSVVSDLLGVSARRMLQAIAEGETDPQSLAKMADPNLRATPDELCNVLQAVATLDPRYRRVLQQFLDQLDLNERQVQELDEQLASALQPHAEAVQRLAEIPGLGVDSAQQIIAEVGPTAEKFASAADLCSWVGTCPGENVSAEESSSSVAEREPVHAPRSGSGGQCGDQGHGYGFRSALSAHPGAGPQEAQPSHLGRRQQYLPRPLEGPT